MAQVPQTIIPGAFANVGTDSVTVDREWNPSLSSNPNYLVMLFDHSGVTSGGGDGRSRNVVIGNCPEQVSIKIVSEWESILSTIMGVANATLSGSLFGKVAGGFLGLTASVYGAAPIPQSATTQIWRGTGPLDFEIPFHFDAYSDAYSEVVDPIKTLVKLISPYRDSFGSSNSTTPNPDGIVLHSPGPTLREVWTSGGVPPSQITFVLGNSMILPSVVLTSLTVQWDARYSTEGYPMSAVANVGLRTHITYAREDYNRGIFPVRGQGKKT